MLTAFLSPQVRAVRLARIFQDEEASFFILHELIHLAGVPVQVDRDDALDALGAFDASGVEAATGNLDIREYGPAVRMDYGVGGSHEGHGGGQDFIATPDAQRDRGQRQGGGP
jgi:hypothetical protein